MMWFIGAGDDLITAHYEKTGDPGDLSMHPGQEDDWEFIDGGPIINRTIANTNVSIESNISGELLYTLDPTDITSSCSTAKNMACGCSPSIAITISGISSSASIKAASQNVILDSLSCDNKNNSCTGIAKINTLQVGPNSIPLVNIVDSSTGALLGTLPININCQIDTTSSSKKPKEAKAAVNGTGRMFW
jgi:hypothetical protein